MTNEQQIRLLELLLQEAKQVKMVNKEIRKISPTAFISVKGFCSLMVNLVSDKVITDEQRTFLTQFIYLHKLGFERPVISSYLWVANDWDSRIEWLENEIKKLKG